MDTIDPEVRADVEYAGRLLAKAIARRQLQVGLSRVESCGTRLITEGRTAEPNRSGFPHCLLTAHCWGMRTWA